MSFSIYKFVNDLNIINSDIKDYYDLVQENEDKLKGKLGKLQLRKMKKLAAQEESSDSEILDYYLTNCKKLKESLLGLDKKIEAHLEYQESILHEYSLELIQNLPEMILKSRKGYNEFIKQYLPVDVTKFVSFSEETELEKDIKMPFIHLLSTATMERLHNHNYSLMSLLNKLSQLKNENTTILQNTCYYDNYLFKYEESDYFEFQGSNYGRLGDDYYKSGQLLTKEAFEIEKNNLTKELESYDLTNPDYKKILNNNFSFMKMQLRKQNLLVKNISRYTTCLVVLYKGTIILYYDNTIIKLESNDLILYSINDASQGPIVLTIDTKEFKRLLQTLEESYILHFMFNQIIAIKGYNFQDQIKKKITVAPIKLTKNYPMIEIDGLEQGQRIEINYSVIIELQELEEGNYYLSLVKSKFEIIKSGEKKIIRVDLEKTIEDIKPVKVMLRKFKVGFNKKAPIYLIQQEKYIIITDLRNYELFEIYTYNEEE